MRWAPRLAVAAAVAVLTTATAMTFEDAGRGDDVLGPGLVTVEVSIDRSRFSVEHLEVRQGTLVQFVVDNQDPIDHELVVGGEDVHARHSTGTERRHPPVPGEVSVPPDARGATFYRFDDAGTVVFACHLPGHAAYGMVGEVEVVA
ncbi:MAG: plastocyanin/azurin family copper-binding protein [Acidimicrobiia bacterium]